MTILILHTSASIKVEFTNFKDTHDTYRCIAPLRLLKVKQKVPEVGSSCIS